MYTIEDMRIGDQYSEEIFVDEDYVKKYAEISGDFSPIHISEEYAKKSIFGHRIVHGMLLGAFISRIIGMHLPGEGTIYVNQSMRFLAPLYLDSFVMITVEVKEIIKEKNRVILNTYCTNKDKKILIGEAIVIPPSKMGA